MIRNTLCVPEAKQRLFCAKERLQQQNDNYPKTRGTYVIQDKVFHWNQDHENNFLGQIY